MTRPSPAQIGRDSVAWGYRMQSRFARQHPWRIDEARRASLRAGRHIVRCQPVDVGLRTGPFNVAVHLPGRIEEDIASTGVYEPHVAWAAASLIPPGTVMVDAGANIGFHSLNVAASRPDVTVHAFEPHPLIAAQLRANIALNPVLGNITAHEVALGCRRGPVPFLAQPMTSYNRGLSSLITNHDLGDEHTQIVVEGGCLDDRFADATVGLIKLDTQGSESEVLEGAVEVLGRCRPLIITEFVSDYSTDPRADLDRLRSFMPDYDLYCLRASTQRDNDHLGAELGSFEAGMVDDPTFWTDLLCLPSERFR